MPRKKQEAQGLPHVLADAGEQAATPARETRYPVSAETTARLGRAFTYHPPRGDQGERYERLRGMFRELAFEIAELTPPGREQDEAHRALETSCFFANAAIARGE
jgi:hypothetical protein